MFNIKNAKEETLNAIQQVVELLANPENQRRLFAMLADMDGEKEIKEVEKEKVVIAPVTEETTDDEEGCDDCIGCKVNRFLEDYPGYTPYFVELRERYMNDEICEEGYVNMLHDYLVMAVSEVTRMNYKPEDLPGFMKEQPQPTPTAVEPVSTETKPRERSDLERSVPWGRNNPSSLTSHIHTTAEQAEVKEMTTLDEQKDVAVRHRDWLNLQVEMIKQQAIIKALYQYSKGLEKQLELESGITIDSSKFDV